MSTTFKKGYFTEVCPLWPGRSLSVKILKQLVSVKTDYQFLEIFDGEGFGRMMALDGEIQLAEADEFIYHEMFAHVPCFAHPDPSKVLIIGGGDSALARELLRHRTIDQIDLCELDEEVIRQCSIHFPWTKKTLNDIRVNLIIEDGTKFVKRYPGTYDIVFVDGPDPIGPGEALFTSDFLKDCRAALKPGGILVSQSESYLLHPDVTERQCRIFKNLFRYSGYYTFSIPSYPGGSLGFCIGCDDHRVDVPLRHPLGKLSRELKMYSPEIHRASFVLPPFWRKRLESGDNQDD